MATRDRSRRVPTMLLGVALMAGAAAACSDRGDVIAPPVDDFDAVTVANSVFSLRFAPSNIALLQVNLIAEALGFLDVSAAEAAGTAPRLSLQGGSEGVTSEPVIRGRRAERMSAVPSFATAGVRDLIAGRLRTSARGSASASGRQGTGVPLFPLNFLGKTFAYDPGSISYFTDDAFGPGPADGVRFFLYDLDFATGLPATPLIELGYVDLIDLSDANSTGLRVRAIETAAGDAVLADYVIDGAFAVSSQLFAVSFLGEGVLADVDGRFDFELDELLEFDDLTNETILSLDDRVVSDEGAVVRVVADGVTANDGSSSDIDFVLTISGPGGTTQVELRVQNDLQDGVLRHDGRREVLIGGTITAPIFQPAGAGGFTSAELAALDEILFAIDDVLILASDLLLPLSGLFGVL